MDQKTGAVTDVSNGAASAITVRRGSVCARAVTTKREEHTMSQDVTITLSVGFRWWVRWCLYALLIACSITGRMPNHKRVARWIERGLYVKSKRAPDAS